MRILVACEYSGRVRDAFRALGHDAWSCDLLQTEVPGPHIIGDVLSVLHWRWDLMVAHPPCTHLSVSGARWWAQKQAEQANAHEFVRKLADAPIERICIENPIGALSRLWRKPDQIIQPWQFGHPESKATCLWLKGLPKLQPSDVLPHRDRWENQTASGQNKLSPSPDRWKIRSRTYEGIAAAMAAQWGKA